MESLLVVLSPVVVWSVTQGVKKIQTIKFLDDPVRTGVLRFSVAALSFLAAIGSSLLNGQNVDVVSIQTFSDTAVAFLGATGMHYFFSRK